MSMHDDLQLGAREKVVQQMTREGLVETNLAKKKKHRLSSRSADDGFELKGDSAGHAEPDMTLSPVSRQKKRYVQKLRSTELGAERKEAPNAEQAPLEQNYEAPSQPADEALLPESSEAQDFEEFTENGIESPTDSSPPHVVRQRLSDKSIRADSRGSLASTESDAPTSEGLTRRAAGQHLVAGAQAEEKPRLSRGSEEKALAVAF